MFYNKNVIKVIAIIAMFAFHQASGEYIEGIDTTDADGYGLDSIFQITISPFDKTKYLVEKTDKSLQIIFYFQETDEGYYHYSFDDLRMAPVSVKPNNCPIIVTPLSYCFIIQTKDHIYAKIKVIKETDANRFIFRWGMNITPDDNRFIPDEYDRTIYYKPNSLHMWYNYDLERNDSISWEPPLDNDNQLIGYIFYLAKEHESIDTTAPIDVRQWDSTFVGDSICKIPCNQWPFQYYNIIAVYREGRSDFLEGWTCNAIPAESIDTLPKRAGKSSYHIKSVNGLFISESVNTDFSVFNMLGRRIGKVPDSRIFNSCQMGAPKGRYILKVEFPDHRTVTRHFGVVR